MRLSVRLSAHTRLICALVVLLAVFLLSFHAERDTDAWLHLSLGRLVFEERGMPAFERYTFPSEDRPFLYSSWLFGVAAYAIYLLGGWPGLVLFKTSLLMAAFFLLYRDSLLPRGSPVLAAIVLIAVAFMSEYRFVLRPDAVMMACLAANILLLNLYLYEGRRYIYILPLVNMVWGNSHSSINLMPVVFGAFVAGGAAERLLDWKLPARRWSGSTNWQLIAMASVGAASVIGSMVSPYGVSQYFFGADILGVGWNKQEIIEFLPPSGREAAVLAAWYALTATTFLLNRERFALRDLLLMIPFCALPFLMRRAVFMALIVTAPVIVRNLSGYLYARESDDVRAAPLRSLKAGAVMAGILAILGMTYVKEHVYFAEWRRFGLGVDASLMPEKVVGYMDREGIEGRVFNTFTYGQYITWTGYPKRTVIVDARGYLEPSVLEKVSRAAEDASGMQELYDSYGFESIVLPNGLALLNAGRTVQAFEHPQWALVFWDDHSRLYLRRGGPYQRLIDRDEYIAAGPGISIETWLYRLGSTGSWSRAEAELKRNLEENDSNIARLLLAILYGQTSRPQKARDILAGAVSGMPEDYRAFGHYLLGEASLQLGDNAGAIAGYEKALALRETPEVLYRLGVAYKTGGDCGHAAGMFERALKLNERLENPYTPMIECYRALGNKSAEERALARFESLRHVMRSQGIFERGIIAYRAGDLASAEAAFGMAVAEDPKNALALTNLGFVYLDTDRVAEALRAFERALAVDPARAGAHYGLGLIYKKTNEPVRSAEHFRRYLELEPRGYFSRRAQEEVQAQGW